MCESDINDYALLIIYGNVRFGVASYREPLLYGGLIVQPVYVLPHCLSKIYQSIYFTQ